MDDYENDYENDDIYDDTIDDLLDSLYEIVDSAGGGLFGKGKFDKNEALNLIDDIRGEIPKEVRRSRDILDKCERIINDAKTEAKRIINDAKNEAQKMVSQHEIIKAVNEEAKRHEEEVIQYSRDICLGANRYAESCLSKVAEMIERSLDEFNKTSRDTEKELRDSLEELYRNKDVIANSEFEQNDGNYLDDDK